MSMNIIDSNGHPNVSEIIRNDVDCGICSYVWTTINAAYEAIKNGYVPIVNFMDLNYPQFHDCNTCGRVNFWEDYFKQPFGLSIDDVRGFNHIKIRYDSTFELDCSDFLTKKMMVKLVLNFSEELKAMIESSVRRIDMSDTVGVLIRGSDYRNIMPKGHPVQPSIDEVVKDVVYVSEKYGIHNVFLVTDEKTYAERISDGTGLNVIHNQSVFVNNNTNSLNSHVMRSMDYETKKKLNMEYLSNVVVLSKLKYNVLSNTSALEAYRYFRILEDEACYEKTYNLGVYQ